MKVTEEVAIDHGLKKEEFLIIVNGVINGFLICISLLIPVTY